MSNLDSIEGSAPGGSFDVFFPIELLMFHFPNSLEVSALVVGFLPLSACLEIIQAFVCPIVPYFRGLFKVLGRNALQLQTM